MENFPTIYNEKIKLTKHIMLGDIILKNIT